MTKATAIEYAVTKIPEILPLEEQDVKDLCNQILNANTTPDTIADGFMNILGQDEIVFEFIFRFNELLAENSSDTKTEKVIKPTQQPVSKPSQTEKAVESTRSKTAEAKKDTIVRVPAKPIQSENSSTYTKKEQPKPRLNRQTGKKKKLQSLEEIDDAVKLLDITNSRKNTKEYTCSCQGRIHPLFELAPNCLSCGKLICIKEGLHMNNCSFCGAELIPMKERIALIEELNKEKEDIETGKSSDNNTEMTEAKKKPSKTYKISSGMGKNLFDEQDKLFDFIERQHERERKREEVLKKLDDAPKENVAPVKPHEVDEELQKAQERLENLLHFQNTSAERTKIIDNASDFDMSGDAGLWGNARERAMLLKKQQRNLRKWEKMERERHGKSDKYVVSMNIGSNGKVTMTEVKKDHGNVYAGSDDELDAISDDEDREDLKGIKSEQERMRKEKDINDMVLQSNIWDYEKNKKQFKRAIYVGSETEAADAPAKASMVPLDRTGKENRVQISGDNDTALEDNILAVM